MPFAQSFQPLSTQESSEMCVRSKMCVTVTRVCSAVPCMVLSPLCELYSMTANFSEAKESYAPKHHFITAMYI